MTYQKYIVQNIKYPKRKHNVYQKKKNTCHDQNKTKKHRCPTALMARHPEVVEDVLESDVTSFVLTLS
jgi:hypothetical protein